MKIGIIGGGNMGEAIARGLLSNKTLSISALLIAEVNADRQDYLRGAFPNSNILSNSEELVTASDIIILAVKPQSFQEVLHIIKNTEISTKIFLSIAAGISTSQIEDVLGEVEVVRAMPNTPALIGEGITTICKGSYLKNNTIQKITAILSSVGDVEEVPEELMDAVTALTGSGPAYIFLFMEAMIAVGIKMGIPRETANNMVLKLFSGTAKLAVLSEDSPQILRKKVTSPGGTTEKALKVLAENEFIDIIMQAVLAAAEHSKVLRERG